MKGTYSVIIGLLAVFFGAACEKFEPAAPNDHDLLDGPVEGLTESENIRFLRGDVAFNDEIFTADALITLVDIQHAGTAIHHLLRLQAGSAGFEVNVFSRCPTSVYGPRWRVGGELNIKIQCIDCFRAQA